MSPAKAVVLIVLATVLGLAVVYQSALLRRCGYRLHELRAEIAEQEAERSAFRAHLSKLKSPRRIVALAGWLGLDLRERPVAVAEAPDAEAERLRYLMALPSSSSTVLADAEEPERVVSRAPPPRF